MNGLIDLNQQDWKEKKHGTSGGKHGGNNLWEKYKTRNEYVRIQRKEEGNFERKIIEKCKNESKVFYRYINEKIKNREGVDKLKVEGIVYKDALQQAEVLTDCIYKSK